MLSTHGRFCRTIVTFVLIVTTAECSFVGKFNSEVENAWKPFKNVMDNITPTEENLNTPVDPSKSLVINSTTLSGILWVEHYGIELKHLVILEGMMANGATRKEAAIRVADEFGLHRRSLKASWAHLKEEMKALFKSGAVSTDYNIIRDHWVSCGLFKLQHIEGDEELTAICGRNTVLGLPVPCRAAKEGIDFNAIGYFHVPQLYEEPNKYNKGKYTCHPQIVRQAKEEARQKRREYQEEFILTLGLTGEEQALWSSRTKRHRLPSALAKSSRSGSQALPSMARYSSDNDEIFVISAKSGDIECSEEMMMFSCYGTCCNTQYGSTEYNNFCTSHDAYSCISAVPFDFVV